MAEATSNPKTRAAEEEGRGSEDEGLILRPQEVWNRPRERLGYLDGLSGLGGLVAPLLAGFSLTAIALLLTSTKEPHLWSWALIAFAGAVAFLLHSMQLAFFAIARDPRPSTQLDWYPEALIDVEAAIEARKRQAETYEDSVKFWHRSTVTYDIGLTAFLAGVVLLVIPYPHHWTGQRIAVVAVAGAAFLLEAWWVLANRLWDWNITVGRRTIRFPHPVFDVHWKWHIYEYPERVWFPHPVFGRSPDTIDVEALDPNRLWAILDPERYRFANPEDVASAQDRIMRTRASSRDRSEPATASPTDQQPK